MEKKEWQKNFEDTIIIMMGRIHLRARDVIEELVPMVELELDKAREEGRLSVIQELLFEPEEPSHNIGTLEAAFKYEDIIKRYSGEWRNKTGLVSPKYIKSKLKDNK